MSDNKQNIRGRPRKGIRIRGMWWSNNALYLARDRSRASTLQEFDDLLNEQLPQTVKWQEFLTGRRDPNDEKVAAVEAVLPESGDCWISPLWEIQEGRWLDNGQIQAFIAKRGWASLLVCADGQDLSSKAAIHPEIADKIKKSATFESLEALAILANLARVRQSPEIADEVERLYRSCCPELSRMPQIAQRADVFFAEVTKIFQENTLSLRRQACVAVSPIVVEPRPAGTYCELQPVEHHPVTELAGSIIEGAENAEPDPKNRQLVRLLDWPWLRIANGLIAIIYLTVISYVHPILLFSMVAIIVIAAAVDQRVANYRIT